MHIFYFYLFILLFALAEAHVPWLHCLLCDYPRNASNHKYNSGGNCAELTFAVETKFLNMLNSWHGKI